MENKEQIGITIVGILVLVIGIVSLLINLFSLFARVDFIVRLAIFPFLVFLPVGIGILYRKDWAQKLTIISLLLLLSCLLYFVFGYIIMYYGWNKRIIDADLILNYIIFFLKVGICSSPFIGLLYFLTRPKVKELFK